LANLETTLHWRNIRGAVKLLPYCFRSLRVRILIWALPALLILLLAVLVVDAFAYQWVMAFVAEQRAQELAETSAARLSHQMWNQSQELMTVANTHFFRLGDASSQALALARAVTKDPQLFGDEVNFLDRRGIVITSQPRRLPLQGYDLHDRPYFQALIPRSGPIFSDIVQDELDGRPMVVIAVPVQGLDGQFLGALITRFYLGSPALASKMPRLGAERSGHIYVLDRTGRVVYHPEERLINQQLPLESVLTKAILEEEHGARLFTVPNEAPQIVGYTTVPRVGWHLVVQEPWETSIAPLRTYLWLGSAALISGVILSIAAIFWGARRISVPVDDLVRQAEIAVQSDYRTRVHSESITELQRLASAFNGMIEQIERYRAGLRRYVAAVTRSQEEERRRIARELHDDTIQSLVAISRRLELLQVVLINSEGAQQQLAELQALVQRTIEGIRRFSQELRPTLLEDLGLIPALRRLVKELSAEGIQATLLVRGSIQDMGPEAELALYRIAQEALNNVRRHAQATRVQVQLDTDMDSICFSVEDNGQGFEMTSSLNDLAQQGSFGLMGIQERVELLEGQMTIHSEVGKGTRLEVRLPRLGKPLTIASGPDQKVGQATLEGE